MDRLWIRFTIAITSVIVFATISTTSLALLDPWDYLFPPDTPDIDDSLSWPSLSVAEIEAFLELLTAQQIELSNTMLYDDGYFSVETMISPNQADRIIEAFPKLDVTPYADGLEYSFDDASLDGVIMNDVKPIIFIISGQISPHQIDNFMSRLSVDGLSVMDEPFLVQNLSLADIFQLLYRQVWPALLVSSILGVGLAIWLSHTLTLPLSRLTEAARDVGGKDLSRRVKVSGSREVLELADTFNQMAENLERAEHLRSQMMADVSHELRTPLTGLESNLRAALDNVQALEEETLAHLYGQTHHLIRLVNDLHEVSLAEAGKLPLTLNETNLTELVEQTVAMFDLLAQEKSITLTHQITAELKPVKADALRLRQVLHNLLANAVRHTPTGGTITLRLHQSRTTTALSIKDTGEGIAPNQLPHIFDRFYRTDPSRNRETGGTGLGLAIAKAIIEAHHGTLTVTSPGLNRGTTFTITLP